MNYVVNLILTVTIVVLATQVARSNTLWGAMIVSIPVASCLSMISLYLQTGDNTRLSSYAKNICGLVLVSLIFFVPFILQPRTGVSFWWNLAIGVILTIGLYWGVQRCFPGAGL